MILSSLRVQTRPESRTNAQFHLFKPLLLIAMGAIFFELLPIDFQYVIAPSLVSYEEVYKADNRNPLPVADLNEMTAVDNAEREEFSLNPAERTIRN